MQRVEGPAPVFGDVEPEIDNQQCVDRPFDGLLNLVNIGFSNDARIIRTLLVPAYPRLYAYMRRCFDWPCFGGLTCKIMSG